MDEQIYGDFDPFGEGNDLFAVRSNFEEKDEPEIIIIDEEMPEPVSIPVTGQEEVIIDENFDDLWACFHEDMIIEEVTNVEVEVKEVLSVVTNLDHAYALPVPQNDISSKVKVLPAAIPSSSSSNVSVNNNPSASRFASFTESELSEFKDENQCSKSTKRKTISNMRLFNQFLVEHKTENRPIETIPPPELDPLLGEFVVSIRKTKPDSKGSVEYEPSYLKGIMNSIDRHLRDKNYAWSILRDKEFTNARSMLTSKQRDLKKKGKGNLPQKSASLLPSELAKFWESGALSLDNPQSLQHTLWWFLVTEAGMRATTEHLHLCWGDVCLKYTSDGRRYLQHNERQTKMRMGEGGDTKSTPSQIFENTSDPSQCPVEAYLKFSQKRPKSMCLQDSKFYLQPIFVRNQSYDDLEIWYKRENLGEHSIKNFMKNMSATANLSYDRKITNTSARKFLVNQMKRAHVPPTDIAQKTGHKNVNSINNYGNINEDDQLAMGLVLRNPSLDYNQAIQSTNPIPATQSIVPIHAIPKSTPSGTIQSTTSTSSSLSTTNNAGRVADMVNFAGASISGGDFHFSINVYNKEQ